VKLAAPPTEAIHAPEREQDPERGLSVTTVARDIVTLGGGTLLGAVFGTLLVFLIPRLVSVEDYGYWRLFVLYSGYVGVLHLGFADGALLRWAGKPLHEFHDELSPSVKFLTWQQLALILPGCLLAVLFLPPSLRFIGITTITFALVRNLATLLQYGLQGARHFRPVAIATAAPAGVFVVLTCFWDLEATPGFRALIVLYFVAWVATLVYLWACLRPRSSATARGSAWAIGKTYIQLGWPIVLANGGFGLVQSADRLAVSSVLPIYEFAQYSLAASAMFVPVTAITAVYRVFFSHVAALDRQNRAKVYSQVSKLLLIAWSLLLPYYFVLGAFVRQFLPKYEPSLPVARILLLGIIFFAGIQILHASFSYLDGRQREFLTGSILAIAASFGLAFFLAAWLHSLFAVAAGQVVVLAFWWMLNEWRLRGFSGQRLRDWLKIVALFAWSAVSYEVSMALTPNAAFRVGIYYLLVVAVLVVSFPEQFRAGWKWAGGSR